MSTSPCFAISAADWCFLRPGTDPAAWYARLRQIGVLGVEMTVPANRPLARAAGLSVLNLSGPGMERGLNRREHHAELLPAIRDVIAEASAERIPQVIVFAGNRAGQAHGEGIANCIAGLSALAEEAARARVVLLFEVLNSYEHADFAADHTGYGVAVVEGVASPAVRLLYDVYHMERMGQDVARDIARHAGLVGHIHLAASPGRDRIRAGVGPDLDRFVPAAIAAGYRGWWGLEFRPGDDPAIEVASSVALLSAAAQMHPVVH